MAETGLVLVYRKASSIAPDQQDCFLRQGGQSKHVRSTKYAIAWLRTSGENPDAERDKIGRVMLAQIMNF